MGQILTFPGVKMLKLNIIWQIELFNCYEFILQYKLQFIILFVCWFLIKKSFENEILIINFVA